MAFLIYFNGKHAIVSPEQGLAVWNAKTGKTEVSKEQKAFVDQVAKVYLNRTTAPKSYSMSQGHVGPSRLPYKD